MFRNVWWNAKDLIGLALLVAFAIVVAVVWAYEEIIARWKRYRRDRDGR